MCAARLTLILVVVSLALGAGAARPATTAAECRSSVLRGGATLQGATGSQLGTLDVHNRGPRACLLVGPARVIRVAGGRRLPLVELSRPSREQRVLLRPGDAVAAMLQLFNACPPGGSTGVLYATFNGGRTQASLQTPPEGRCDRPGRPPQYRVGTMRRISRTRG